MKRISTILFSIIIGMILATIVSVWDDPTASYSGAVSVLNTEGIITFAGEEIIYKSNDSEYSEQELKALAKVSELGKVYIQK